jgi:hypothetical protein
MNAAILIHLYRDSSCRAAYVKAPAAPVTQKSTGLNILGLHPYFVVTCWCNAQNHQGMRIMWARGGGKMSKFSKYFYEFAIVKFFSPVHECMNFYTVLFGARKNSLD